MSKFRLLRYWYRYGLEAADRGEWDCPPVTVGTDGHAAYEAAQRKRAACRYPWTKKG